MINWHLSRPTRAVFVDHFGDLVRDVAVAGADMPYLSALVFPDPVLLAALCRNEIAIKHFTEQLKQLAKHNTGSSNLKKRLILMDTLPSMEAGELTDKGSVNQRAIIQNRADIVDEVYAGSERTISI